MCDYWTFQAMFKSTEDQIDRNIIREPLLVSKKSFDVSLFFLFPDEMVDVLTLSTELVRLPSLRY